MLPQSVSDIQIYVNMSLQSCSSTITIYKMYLDWTGFHIKTRSYELVVVASLMV